MSHVLKWARNGPFPISFAKHRQTLLKLDQGPSFPEVWTCPGVEGGCLELVSLNVWVNGTDSSVTHRFIVEIQNRRVLGNENPWRLLPRGILQLSSGEGIASRIVEGQRGGLVFPGDRLRVRMETKSYVEPLTRDETLFDKVRVELKFEQKRLAEQKPVGPGWNDDPLSLGRVNFSGVRVLSGDV